MRVDFRQLKPYRDYQEGRQLSMRRLVLQVLVACGFALYAGIFWYMQIVRGDEFRAQAEENRLRRLPDRAIRGQLRDPTGEILATSRPSFAVYLDRERAVDPEAEIRALARFLREDPAPMLARLAKAKNTPRFVPLLVMPDVDLEIAARIAAHRPELTAIDVETDPKRYYPLGPAAAHVLGYLAESSREQVADKGLWPGERVGQTGIEFALDDRLRGQTGVLLEEVNARGRALRTVDALVPAVHGTSLTLTVDAGIQKAIETAFAGRAGAAVFLDPRTGALRGLYSGPTYDPNAFAGRLSREEWVALTGDPKKPMLNRAITSAYSPGSTFKIVMAAAALQEGVVEGDRRIFCAGQKTFYGRVRKCHLKGGHGWVGVEEAITRSCNVFFYTVGQELGIEKIARWSKAFGLGEPTGLGLQPESGGLVPSDEWKRRAHGEPWYAGETISVAIGQGQLLVTPMQMARVAAAIANGGYLIHPYVDEADRPTHQPDRIGLAPETIARVKQGMRDVVMSDRGTARRARVKGIDAAGKTGTAQVVALDAAKNPGDHAWFMGFAPVDNPQLAFAIIVENAGHGGAEAAPVAAAVLSEYLLREELGPPEEARQARGVDAAADAGAERVARRVAPAETAP